MCPNLDTFAGDVQSAQWRVKALAKVNTLAGKKQIATGVHGISNGVQNPVVHGTNGVHGIHESHTNKAAKKFIVAVKEMTAKRNPSLMAPDRL
jgi:hypothetical protein